MNTANKPVVVNMNRDPITDSPGSHPVGTGIGSAGGAAAGVVAGAIFGPIGMMVGGTIGAIAGAAVGHEAGELVDPTGEIQYWRNNYSTREYVDSQYSFDTDYQPAYLYGVSSRNLGSSRRWDDALATELERDWDAKKTTSTLPWHQALPAVRDAWDRSDRTYNVYDSSDRYYESRFADADYRDNAHNFGEYRNAYRYGAFARSAHPARAWDDDLETELGRGWDSVKGASSLGWEKSKAATRDAWHTIKSAYPGNA